MYCQDSEHFVTSWARRLLRRSVHSLGSGAAGGLRLLSLRGVLQGVPAGCGVRSVPRAGVPPRDPGTGGPESHVGRADPQLPLPAGSHKQDRAGETEASKRPVVSPHTHRAVRCQIITNPHIVLSKYPVTLVTPHNAVGPLPARPSF